MTDTSSSEEDRSALDHLPLVLARHRVVAPGFAAVLYHVVRQQTSLPRLTPMVPLLQLDILSRRDGLLPLSSLAFDS